MFIFDACILVNFDFPYLISCILRLYYRVVLLSSEQFDWALLQLLDVILFRPISHSCM